MHATGVKAVFGQRFIQNIDIFFAIAEHKSIFDVFVSDQTAKGFAFVHFVNNNQFMLKRGRHA